MRVAQARSSTEFLRRTNSILILRALRERGALSHTDIISETGLASATVSAITAELTHAGIIEQSEQHTPGARGRPRVLLQPAQGCGYLVAIAISSDAVQFSLADYSGRLLDRFYESRNQTIKATAPFVSLLRTSLERICERSQITDRQILAISISSKGIVDSARPVLLWSPIFGDGQIDFADVFAQYDNASIILKNETALVAGALGTRLPLGQLGLAVVSLGHNIGLGLVRAVDGETQTLAPNFSHMLHLPNGARCRCGANGCVEAYAGFYAILRTAFEVPKDHIPAQFVPLSEIDRIADSARRGDRMAGFAFRQAGVALGQGLSRLLSLHGRMPIAITGPGTRYYELMRDGLESGLAETHVVRMHGVPEITLVEGEAELVFEGHKASALERIDEHILGK
ncbi:ROK family transcriptional regulator [Rhizobium sp. L1K21]|uniref:ROK family transcriptional regulator n=1 Tax=Rhizobium sp. L1K21 TaxID=2954933 RepID=UPI00209232AB|nr:ROK family transcriptional regulator [Rhizobium sp. L1K21]MCO6188257.1 ROK family transcriptional regulator [Rhizobium sp. L1K21]